MYPSARKLCQVLYSLPIYTMFNTILGKQIWYLDHNSKACKCHDCWYERSAQQAVILYSMEFNIRLELPNSNHCTPNIYLLSI